jgi:predicted HAD superfamily Cof-like phosphohydrolase
MKQQIARIREFEEAFKITPSLQSPETKHKILLEELNEYLDSAWKEDEVEIADAIGDILYVAFGLVTKHGLDDVIEDIFAEIHASNMSKLNDDGTPIYNEYGKIMKGPNYFKPDISKHLRKIRQ